MHTVIKIIEILKQIKIITLVPTCFVSRKNHHQGVVLCLGKTTKYGFSVLVCIDAVNVMAAYQPVVLPSGSQRLHCEPDDSTTLCISWNNTSI